MKALKKDKENLIDEKDFFKKKNTEFREEMAKKVPSRLHIFKIYIFSILGIIFCCFQALSISLFFLKLRFVFKINFIFS